MGTFLSATQSHSVSTAFPQLASIQHQASSLTVRHEPTTGSQLLRDFVPSHTDRWTNQSLVFGHGKPFLSYFSISEGRYKVSFDLTAEIFNDTLGKHLTRVIPSHITAEQRCRPGFQRLRHGEPGRIPGQSIWATWQ